MTTVEAVTGRTSRLRTYLELVRFSHTVFALPFAIMAVLIAVRLGGDGVWSQPILWLRMSAGVLLCMISARTAAMAFNRLVDRQIDAANPRTANRHLPRGDVRVDEVLLLIAGSSATFIASTLLFLPNWLPLVLATPVLAWLLGYSYAKRFTMLAHV
jgi:4-hydroxybenzoate polyprenyltransferase